MNKDKEKDLEEERVFLKELQEFIGKEMEKRLATLSDLRQEIVDYRKYLFEEIPQKQHHITNHDNPVREANYTATYERISELSRMYYQPYFGMIRFRDPDEEESEQYYIGKSGLTDQGEPIILDWRTPVASLFYQQRLGEMTYKAPYGSMEVDLEKRRQYILKKGELKGMFDSEIDIKDDILQMVLSGNSGARLKDIIATIQKEQDDIIREPLEYNVFLDGVAGSGKTTIILHRIAYLLYNYRERLKDNILILGPNRLFMEYISDVLPDLGEQNAAFQLTIPELAKEVVHPRHPVLDAERYFELLDQDPDFGAAISHKSSAAYHHELDQAFKNFEQAQTASEDLIFQDHLLMSAEERNQLFFKTYAKTPYIRRCRRILRQVRQRLKNLRNDTTYRLNKAYQSKIQQAKNESNYNRAEKLKEEAYEVLKKYYIEVYRYSKTLRDLYQQPDAESWYEAFTGRTDAAVAWDEEDLLGLLYIYCKLHGKGAYPVKLLVIDEAQDVSAFGFQTIKKLTGAESFTVVGDLHQKVRGRYHHSMMEDPKSLLRPQELEQVHFYDLKRSYRSTPEIMDYASAFLKNGGAHETVDREGEPVVQEDFASAEELQDLLKTYIADMRGKAREHMGVLTRTPKEAARIAEALTAIGETFDKIENEKDSISCDLAVIPVYLAKGLEFDGVIAVEWQDGHWNEGTSYILCTRALHQLVHLREK